MAQSPNTQSTLQYKASGNNKTSTALSTNIIIKVNNTPVGAVQSLNITEQRTIKMIDEVGTDGHIDSAPQTSTKITGDCTRVRFDRLRAAEAFSRSFVHVASQIYPFDIFIYDRQKTAVDFTSGLPSNNLDTIITVIKNVWINNISYSYTTTDWIIQDKMNFEAETIYSIYGSQGNDLQIGTAGSAVARGGEISVKSMDAKTWGNIERIVDTGGRRGSMDVAGIITIGNGGDEIF